MSLVPGPTDLQLLGSFLLELRQNSPIQLRMLLTVSGSSVAMRVDVRDVWYVRALKAMAVPL